MFGRNLSLYSGTVLLKLKGRLWRLREVAMAPWIDTTNPRQKTCLFLPLHTPVIILNTKSSKLHHQKISLPFCPLRCIRPHYAVHVCAKSCHWDTRVLDDLRRQWLAIRALMCTQVPGWWQGPGLQLQCGPAPSLLLQECMSQAELVKGICIRRRSNVLHRSLIRWRLINEVVSRLVTVVLAGLCIFHLC